MSSAPVTIKDLARATGVNISTVSRALNGSYGVHDETRKHVLRAAARLGYRPNRIARGLATGRSHTLGLVVSDIRNPFFAEVARGAEDAASKAGLDLVLCNSDLDPDKQMRYCESLMEKRVDGIMMNSVSALVPAQVARLAAAATPIVLLNRAAPKTAFSTVCADYESGGALAGEHLLSLGHRHVAHITGPRANRSLADRADGLRRACEKAGVEPTILHGKNSFAGAVELTRKLLADHPQITAISAANDSMAFGAMRVIYERGLRIPHDVSLIGFDNVELSSIMHPPLTTIHQPKYEMGAAAVEILLRLTERKENPVPEHRLFGVELIERQSTAPPRPT